MIATKPNEFRNNQSKYMEQAYAGEPVVIARPKNHNVVVISEESYNMLLKAQRNAEYLEKLDRSFEELERNNTISLSLDELNDMESDNWMPNETIKDFTGISEK